MSVRIENGRKALVLGCGASGRAAAKFLLRRGWSVAAADTRSAEKLGEKVLSDLAGIELRLGGLPQELPEGTDLLVISPGLSPEHSEAASVVASARASGVDVAGEIELFARELKRLAAVCGYRPTVIGITGTNGKTTTTTIVGKMVEAAGRSVCVAGNIGPNAVSELDRLLAAGGLPDYWVLELSSFQLETTASIECAAAAFLNLTEDHVDWHGTMENYGRAKARIFASGTLRVLNRDDPASIACAVKGAAVASFGAGVPEKPGEWGIAAEGALDWLAFVPGSPKLSKRASRWTDDPARRELLMPAGALRIRGRHNAMNALAALALATGVGLPLASSLSVLTTYAGEPHRVQFVLETRGVEFIDDSKGTNVGATAAALEGLGAGGRKCSIILGGDGKGQDFSPIAAAIAAHARHVVLIGRDAPLIEKALAGVPVPVENAGTDFGLAVELAWRAAKEGDAVLLSPACASWDMFRNYAERSELFIEKAREIALSCGTAV